MLLGTPACSAPRSAVDEVQAGQTRPEVTAIAGDPDEVTEFVLPSEPFFGPQEALTSLLPAGTLVEEWKYITDDQVTYVWFSGPAEAPRQDWTVIETAVYPADAIY